MSLNKSEALSNAEQRIRQGQVSEAIAIYKMIIEADPSDLSAIGALSQLYIKAGQIQEAINDFSRIADSYLDKGSPIKSAYILKKILELDPSNAASHAKLGEIYLHEGMSDKAYDSFITAGVVFMKKGNVAEALEANKKALAVRPESHTAASAIEALRKRDSSNSENAASQSLTPNGEPDNIQQSLDSKPAPANPIPPGFDDAVVVQKISMAEYLVGYGKVEQSIALLKDTLHYRPDHIDVRVKLKDIYLRSEMMEKASAECFEIASIYAARGDTARARDYTVRAQRLAQLLKPPQPREQTRREVEPQAASSNNGDSIVTKEATEARAARRKAESTETQVPLKAAPAAALVAESPAPVKFVVEKTPPAVEPDNLKIQTGDTALVLSSRQERSLAAVTEQATAVSNSFPSTTLGIMLVQPETQPKTKRKTRRWLYAAMIALVVLGALAAVVFKGLPLYEARLDREFQALEQATPLPALPLRPDSATNSNSASQGESEPVEQMEVRASDYPALQPNKPARVEEETQPARNAEPAPQSAPPVAVAAAASESPGANKTSPPTPPIIAPASNSQGGVETAVPRGGQSSLPANAAALPEPEPPPAARKPGAIIKGESIKKAQPDYPALARSTGQSGMVSVEITISEKGDVIAARALSGPPLLRDAAVSAARRWKFKPSTRDSTPVVSTSVISFNFKL